MALVMVILVLVILVVLATGFAAFTASDMRASDATIDSTTSYFLAQAGVDYAIYLIKHNMAVYPIADATNGASNPTSDDVGYRYLGTNARDPWYSSASYSEGQVCNLFAGQEHVVVSELAYTSSLNWMYNTRYCGTFSVSMAGSSTGGVYAYKITSIGYIKRYPQRLASTSDTALQASDFSDVSTWAIKCQRTVYADFSFNATDTNLYTNSSGVSTSMTGSSSYITQPQDFYEKWR